MKRTLRLVVAAMLFGGLFGGLAADAVFAADPPIVVKPSTLATTPLAPAGWYFWNDRDDLPTGSPGEFAAGPASPPLGVGSVRLGPLTDAGATGAGHSVIATNAYFGTPLASITSIQYSTFQPGPTLAVAFQFDVRYRSTDTKYGGRLVFEPYRTGTVGAGWQTWSPLGGLWWATKTVLDGNNAGTGGLCGQSSPCTWGQILSLFPEAQIYGRTLLKAGSGTGWNGFAGNADALTIGVNGADVTYDFEPETGCTTDCYVDAVTGNNSFGGDSPSSAKKTISAAIAQVVSGGTVHVGNGTYKEQVVPTRAVTIIGDLDNPANVTIDGENKTDLPGPGQLRINDPAGAVSFKGFRFINTGRNSSYDYYAVFVKSNWAVTIENCEIIGHGSTVDLGSDYALWAYNRSGPLNISGNSFSSLYHGILIELWQGPVTIEGNTFDSFVTGLYSGATYGGRAIESIVYSNATISALQKVAGNKFSNFASTGVMFSGGFSGVGPGKFTNVEISSNEFNFVATDIVNLFGAVNLRNVSLPANDDPAGGVAASIHNNTISVPSGPGILVTGLNGAITVTGNSIFGNGKAGIDAGTSLGPIVNGTCNWWGASNGPGPIGPGSGDAVTNYVTFLPWLTSPFGPCDTTPPELSVPASPLTVYAMIAPAPVTFDTSASDDADGLVTVTCTPASGSSFSVGDTMVTCKATDASGNEAPASFVVRVVLDTTPPVIDPHANVEAAATSPAGAVVTYALPSASDADSGLASLSCVPPSGSQFSLGSTTVTCTAVDYVGNSSTSTFTVIVGDTTTTPGQMIGDGYLVKDRDRYHFNFNISEGVRHAWRNRFQLRIDYEPTWHVDSKKRHRWTKRDDDRFVATSFEYIGFSDDPTFKPGRAPKPQIDTVVFSGKGKWNGQPNHTFEVTATDQGEPGRRRETIQITIKASGGAVVATISGQLSGGNIQSMRLKR